MKSIPRLLALAVLVVFFPLTNANAESNPFPGVPFDGEIPGYTTEVNCGPGGDNSSSGVDCGIGIVPFFNCPPGSAADGRNGYANDGPPGDPHKKVGVARRFCRNSWTPPPNPADEEDFRNRQQLAIAAATLESQVYNAAHPGEQKCVTWGPIVHANGISTASGGVCANPVGTKPDGSTSQVAPSHVGSDSSGQVNTSPAVDTATPSSLPQSPNTLSQSALSGAQTLIPFIDLTQYGFGRPFTKVVSGNLSATQCPLGFQAATNIINTGFSEYGATECWPENAWAAYSIGGDVWSQFKLSNGAVDAQAETNRRIQVNALRALALQQAQMAANETIGIKRCNSWSGYGESGQECAYVPVQNNNLFGAPVLSSSGDSTTTNMPAMIQVGDLKTASEPGISLAKWQQSESYTAFICPTGSGKSTTIDLKGTVTSADDVWITTCVQLDTNLVNIPNSETATQVTPAVIDTNTAIGISFSLKDSSTAKIESDPIIFKGSLTKISELVSNLEIDAQESAAIRKTTAQLNSIKTTSKLVKLILPNSPVLKEEAKSLTPLVCRVQGLVVQPKKVGSCQITYTFVGESGNSFETTKKITFKN